MLTGSDECEPANIHSDGIAFVVFTALPCVPSACDDKSLPLALTLTLIIIDEMTEVFIHGLVCCPVNGKKRANQPYTPTNAPARTVAAP